MADHPLLDDIETFIATHGMAESTFGRLASNDWKLIGTLRSGRRLWPETERKIRTFMAGYRPGPKPTLGSPEQPAEQAAA